MGENPSHRVADKTAYFPNSKCIICGGRTFRKLYTVTDTNQDIPGQWTIIECESCKLGILSPFPEQSEVASFYKGQFYTDGGQRFRSWVERIRLYLAGLRGRILNRLMPQKGRLLDFGSGAGHFAAAQKRAGWQVWPIDPYSQVSEYADKVRMRGDEILLEFPDGFFDAITLWYVIEHLRNPTAAIREFHRVLRPGGLLVLSQQDFASFQARIFGSRWLYLDPPRHLWQFNEDNLCQLARAQGFELLITSHASIESGPFTILQSTLNVLLGNKNYLFRLLKNEKLPATGKDTTRRIPALKAVLSILLGALLAPFALLAYRGLLLGHSGDVFTVYLVRK